MNRIRLIVLFFLMASCLWAQSPQQTFQAVYQKGVAAYEAKDYTGFIYAMQTADSIRPNTYNVLYNLAGGLSLAGKLSESAMTLRRMFWINTSAQWQSDDDFANFKKSPLMPGVLSFADSIKKIVSKSDTAFQVRKRDFHPEGIAYDSSSDRFFLGSIRERRILIREKNGQLIEHFFQKTEVLYSAMGMKIDGQTLWVATSAMPEMIGYSDSLKGRAAVLRFSLMDGQLEKVFTIQGSHVFGDLVVAPNGDVYISDSQNPSVFKITKGSNTMELWMDIPNTWNLQGLDFSDNGKFLFIADYISGIYRIDLQTKNVIKLKFANHEALRGIDGLYVYGKTLITLQNGVNPLRVCRYELNDEQNTIQRMEFIDNSTRLNEPTLGVKTGNALYYIANSPWGAYDRDGRFNTDKSADPLILKCVIK